MTYNNQFMVYVLNFADNMSLNSKTKMKSGTLDQFLLKRRHPKTSLEDESWANKGGSTEEGNSQEENLASGGASNPQRNLNKECEGSGNGSNSRMEASLRQNFDWLIWSSSWPRREENDCWL